MSKEVYATKVKELSKKVNELKSKQAVDAQKFEREFEQSTGKIQGALVDVLSMIANKNNLDLVLAKSQVILVGRDIDLTDIAVKELNKVLPKYPKISLFSVIRKILIDKSFYKNIEPISLLELATKLSLKFHGDQNFLIKDIGPLESAGLNEISFYHNTRYKEVLKKN